MKPALRGFTLNVSMALAIVGEEIFRSSSSTFGSIGVMSPPVGSRARRGARPPGSDGFAAALDQHLADLLDHRLDLLQVGVHRQGPLEVFGGALQLPLLEVDQAEARERAEVDRVPPDHLLAVG